jgi:membrane protein
MAGMDKSRPGEGLGQSREKDDSLDYAREITPAMQRGEHAGHGHEAAQPSDIPSRGWKQVVMRVFARISLDNLSIIAAGVAFYAFLAIPSALTALVALYGLAFDPQDVQRQIASLNGAMPGAAVQLIGQQLQTVTSQPQSTLGVGFIVALLVAMWGARSAMSTFITALNVAYAEDEKRGFFRFQAAAFALTALAVVFAVLSIALIAVLPAAINFLPFGDFGKTVASVIRWPVLFVLVILGLAVIYRYAPSREEPKWRWVSWGAGVATVLWIAGSALFSIYVGQFASYNKTYGSLGAVVVLMMWLYVSAFAVLLGAELNAELEHQTARDTTTGRPRPMGQRGAWAADTVTKD